MRHFPPFPAFAELKRKVSYLTGWDMSRLIILASAIIIAAIIADCGVIGFAAYRWFVFSEAPGAKMWSGLIVLTAAVVFALIRVRDMSRE